MSLRWVINCACGWAVMLVAASSQAEVVGTAVNYQGQLKRGGASVTDVCMFEFTLWDAASNGVMVAGPVAAPGTMVTDGLFEALVDFGPDVLTGAEARYLEVAVQCSGDVGFTVLSPRQQLTPAPTALALPGFYTQENLTSPNVIGGHSGNAVQAGAVGAVVGGGGEASNTNTATGDFGQVGGGRGNRAGNLAGTATDATVGGGFLNTAASTQSTVAGGLLNVAQNLQSTVGGGRDNVANGIKSTVGGGQGNHADGDFSFVGGGRENTAGGLYDTVGGGRDNTASGGNATVAGGQDNTAAGAFSVAAGQRAQANHDGTFVFSDSTTLDPDFFASTAPDQFLINAAGGVGINTNGPQAALHVGGIGGVDGIMFPDGTLQTTAATGGGGGDGHSLDAADGDPVDVVFVDTAGFVGVGTTAPRSPLELIGAGQYAWNVGEGTGDLSISVGTVGLSIGMIDQDLPSNCCEIRATPGCNDPAVEARVCASLPGCCSSSWALPCAAQAGQFGDCTGPEAGDARIWTHGGSNRLALGNPIDGDVLIIEGERVSIGEYGHEDLADPELEVRGEILVTGPGRIDCNRVEASSTVETNNLTVHFDAFISGDLTAVGTAKGNLVEATSAGFKFPDATVQTTAFDGHSLDAADGDPVDAVFVDATGQVGVNTNVPGAALHVSGVPGVDGIMFPDGTIQTTAASVDNHSLDALDGDPVDAVFVDNDGNVGVGTNGPAERLQVIGNIAASGTIQSGNSIIIDGTSVGLERITSTDVLEIHTSDWGVWRLEPATTIGLASANVVAGSHVNFVGSDVFGATVAGGGAFDHFLGNTFPNRVTESYGTVSGGFSNEASGNSSTVPGGSRNLAAGANSFAAGRRAKALHDGAFVWADSTNDDFESVTNDSFLIRASGGVGIGHDAPISALDVRTSDMFSSIYAKNTSFGLTISGVYGVAAGSGGNQYGLRGAAELDSDQSNSAMGVLAVSTSMDEADAYGGFFNADAEDRAYGVWAYGLTATDFAYGVYATADTDNSSGTTTYGVYSTVDESVAPTSYAGYFDGDLHVTGDLSAAGLKPFRIDHPLDPENRYLYHYALESPEVLNFYRGTVVLAGGGEAWAELPGYFETINREFTYQLTAVGAPMPNLHVAQKIAGTRFKIAGGVQGKEVSWQVTGVRNDPYIREYGAPVDVEKPDTERGFYQHPELYAQPEERGVEHRHREAQDTES